MAQVEYEVVRDGVALITLNRPERLNAMGQQLMTELAEAWNTFEGDPKLLVAILTGRGRGFCAGEDLKEAAERGQPGLGELTVHDPYFSGEMTKPTIAAVNGWAIGGGVALTSLATLRVAARSAVFEFPQVKHWGIGSVQGGIRESLPVAIANELALGFRVSGERAYEVGFVNRFCEDGEVVDTALELAEHLVGLRHQTVLNTVDMLRELRPTIPEELEARAAHLRVNGVDDDIMESRRAFAKRKHSAN